SVRPCPQGTPRRATGTRAGASGRDEARVPARPEEPAAASRAAMLVSGAGDHRGAPLVAGRAQPPHTAPAAVADLVGAQRAVAGRVPLGREGRAHGGEGMVGAGASAL